MDGIARGRLKQGKIPTQDITAMDNPLDFIADDHMREREVCALIDRMVLSATPDPADCGQVISFLKFQLPQHLADEEIDLFPLMLARCEPEDGIETVINRLHSDHGHAKSDTLAVIEVLEAQEANASGFDEAARNMLAEFADHARRHLILENAIVLPIARSRLTAEDLTTMKQNMLERRRLDSDGGKRVKMINRGFE